MNFRFLAPRAATLGVGGAAAAAAVAYFRSMPPPGPGAPPQENYLRSIERLQLRAQMEEKGERRHKTANFPPDVASITLEEGKSSFFILENNIALLI